MIGCEVEEVQTRSFVDGKMILKMPDGQEAHIDFLKLEEIQPKLFN
jgi:coenzyme F420-reducing hydrogenase beta subunit